MQYKLKRISNKQSIPLRRLERRTQLNLKTKHLMYSKLFLIIQFLVTLSFGIKSEGTSDSETVYLRKPNDKGPLTWDSGIRCLDMFSTIYLRKAEKMTRSKNMVITHLKNLSAPAAQIEAGFLKYKNSVTVLRNYTGSSFQIRVFSDRGPRIVARVFETAIMITDFYVIVIDNFEGLLSIVEKYLSRAPSWNPGGKFLILYNNVDVRNQSLQTAQEVFRMLLVRFYINQAAFMYATNATGYDFYVMDNFNPRTCRQVQATKVATCDMGRIPSNRIVQVRVDQFSKNMKFKNCTFYLCTSISAPFIEADCESGIEMNLINIIKKSLGFKLNLTCSTMSRGVINKEGVWTDLLGKLNERSCDFILGGFYPDNEVSEDFWVTDTYLSDSHTWFIYLAPVQPRWKGLFTIFKPDTWIAFILVMVLTWCVWFTLGRILPENNYHKSLSLTALNNWGVSLGASILERPVCHASRVFLAGLTLYEINVMSIYTSKLIAVFKHPGYQHQISTIEEVFDVKLPFGGYEETQDWFENEDDMKIFNNFNYTDFDPTAENLAMVRDGKKVILANRMYIMQTNISDDIYGFPDNVFSSPLEMIVKSGFPFLFNFNKIIRYMRDAGLFDKIDRDFKYNNSILAKIRKNRPIFEESAVVLTTSHLEGAFGLAIVGILMSFVMFLLELLTFYFITPWLSTRSQNSTNGKAFVKRRKQRNESREKYDKVIKLNMPDIRYTPVKRRKLNLNKF